MANMHKKALLLAPLILIILFTIPMFTRSNEYSDKINITSNPNKDDAIYFSNRYTQMETDYSEPINSLVDLGEDHTFVAENDTISLYVRNSDLSIRVVSKETGYVWGSSFSNNVRISKLMQTLINSPIVINYYNANNNAVTEESVLRAQYNIDTCYENCDKLEPSTIVYRPIERGFEADIVFGISKISLTLRVYLDDTSLIFEVPYESIKDGEVPGTPGNRLKDLRIYPFFGAVKDDEIPGYMFIPDGVGALMRFAKPNDNESNAYYKRFYDIDIGVDTVAFASQQFINDPANIYFAVYGMVHGINHNGYLTIVEEGAEYADLYAWPSRRLGIVYQYMYASFNYRTNFMQPTNQKNTNRIYVIQPSINPVNIKLRYNFLSNDNASYVGMAKNYREYLVEKGMLSKKDKEGNIPLLVDVIGAENTKGLIFDKTIAMTKVKDLQEMIQTLNDNEINNITVIYRGWTKGGVSNTAPDYFPFEKKLGSKDDFKELIEWFNANPANQLLFYADYVKAYEDASGYDMNDVSRRINRLINTYRDGRHNYYYLRPSSSLKVFNKDINQYKKYNINNLAIDTIGNVSFSDYADDKTVSRTMSIKYYQDLLSKVPGKVGLFAPNDYMLGHADMYFETPIYSSQYMKFKDTVPFIPIVLSGYLDAFAPHSNFFSDTTDELLRVIDFGLFPAYYLTHESAYLLLETSLNHIFTSKFADWKNEVIRQYNFINGALRHVYGHSIVNRVMLKTGVAMVTYDNNVSIIINYTSKDFIYDDEVIPANNYKVIGVIK